MTKKSKLVYIIGSIAIGVIALLVVLCTLIAGNFVNVNKNKLVFASSSAEYVFDGETHESTEWKLVNGTLRKGHRAEVVVSGEQTEVGECQNFISAVIYDENDADVSEYYDIEYQVGVIKVHSNVLQIVSENESVMYDGKEHSGTRYSYTGSLPSKYQLKLDFSASGITNVGIIDNAFTVSVVDRETLEDKTASFTIEKTFGKLEVTKRPITLRSKSANKVYDGKPFTEEEYAVVEVVDGKGSLAEGDEILPSFNEPSADAEAVENYFSATIVYGGYDISGNYQISYTYGSLRIDKRPITITTKSAEKTYDGTPLRTPDETADYKPYEYLASELADGQTLQVNVTGTRTEKGESNNLASVRIIDNRTDRNVIQNYDVTLNFGTLKVAPMQLSLTTNGAMDYYDGEPLIAQGFIVDEGIDYTVNGEGKVVLDLTGHIVDLIDYTNNRVEVGYSHNEATLYVVDALGNDVTDNYVADFTYGGLEVRKRPLMIQTPSTSREYNGEPLVFVEADPLNPTHTIIGETSVVEGQYEVLEYDGTRTNVGESLNTALVKIYNSELVEVTAQYDISVTPGKLTVRPAPITFTTLSYKGVYNGELQGMEYSEAHEEPSSRFIIAPGLVGDHYAEPVDFYSSKNAVVASNTVKSLVIKDGDGVPVTENYTVTAYTWGTFEIEKFAVNVQTADYTSAVYDGEEHDMLTDNLLDITFAPYSIGGGVLANEAHRIDITNAVKSTNVITTYNTADIRVLETPEEGDPIDVTDNYNMNITWGVFKINPREVTVTTRNYNTLYDNKNQSIVDEYDNPDPADSETWPYILTGEMVDDHFLYLSDFATEKDAGVYDNVADSTKTALFSGGGQKPELLGNYKINYVWGKLNIQKRNVSLITVDKQKTYDTFGFEDIVTYNGFDEESGIQYHPNTDHEFAAYNSVAVVFGNAVDVTDAGEYVNDVTVSVFEPSETAGDPPVEADNELVDGVKVYKNYVVNVTEGTLIIKKAPVSVTAIESLSVFFNANDIVLGSEVEQEYGEYKLDPLLTAELGDLRKYLQANYLNKQTAMHAGFYDNKADFYLTKIGDTLTDRSTPEEIKAKSLNHNCDITYTWGKVQIKQLPITIHSESQKWDEPLKDSDHKNNVWWMTIDDVVEPQEYRGEITTGDAREIRGEGNRFVLGAKNTGVIEANVKEATAKLNTIEVLYIENRLNPESPIDISNSVKVTLSPGFLIVGDVTPGMNYTSAALNSAGAPGSGELAGGDDSAKDNFAAVVTVTSDTNPARNIYLKYKSYGNFNGTAWGSDSSNQATAASRAAVMLGSSGMVGDTVGVSIPSGDFYLLPYYVDYSDLTGNQDGVTANGTHSTNTAYYTSYDYDYYYQSPVSNVATSTSGYTTVPSDTAAYLASLGAEITSLNTGDARGTAKNVVDYFRKNAYYRYDLNYRTSWDEKFGADAETATVQVGELETSDRNVKFMATGVGICQHYATAATLIMRYLGYQARYTGGFVCTTEQSNVSVMVRGEDAHAWTEVFDPVMGWVYIDATTSNQSPAPDTQPDDTKLYDLVVTTPSRAAKIFDGQPLTCEVSELSFVTTTKSNGTTANGLPTGYTARIKADEMAALYTDAGSGAFIVPISITSGGRDVTDQFNITYNPGTYAINVVGNLTIDPGVQSASYYPNTPIDGVDIEYMYWTAPCVSYTFTPAEGSTITEVTVTAYAESVQPIMSEGTYDISVIESTVVVTAIINGEEKTISRQNFGNYNLLTGQVVVR